MKTLKTILIVTALAVVGYFAYQYFHKGGSNQSLADCNFSIVVPKKQIVTAIDSCGYKASRKYTTNKGLKPWIKVEYAWTFSIQFKVELDKLHLDYNKKTKVLKIGVDELNGNDMLNFNIQQGYPKVSSSMTWNEKGNQADKYLGQYLTTLTKTIKQSEYSGKNIEDYKLEGWQESIAKDILGRSNRTNKATVIATSRKTIVETLMHLFGELKYDTTGVTPIVTISKLTVFGENVPVE